MTPRIIPLTPVELDKPRNLLFDRMAVKLAELELTRIWGREYTFYQALRMFAEMLQDNDLSKLSFLNVSVLLWAGCAHEDETLTRAMVEDALPYTDPRLLIAYVGIILQAWKAVAPPAVASIDEDGEVIEEPNPLAGSTGTASGPLSASALA